MWIKNEWVRFDDLIAGMCWQQENGYIRAGFAFRVKERKLSPFLTNSLKRKYALK